MSRTDRLTAGLLTATLAACGYDAGLSASPDAPSQDDGTSSEGAAPPGSGAPEPDPGPSARPGPSASPSLATCTPEPAWVHRGDRHDFAYSARRFDTSPGGELLLRSAIFGGQVFRTRDGVEVASRIEPRRSAQDTDWRFSLEPLEAGAVAIGDLETGETIASIEPEATEGHRAHPTLAAIAPEADVLVTATCWTPREGDAPGIIVVESHDLADGSRLSERRLHVGCHPSFGQSTLHLLPTPDARGAVLAGLGAGQLAFVDLDTGAFHVRDLALGRPVAVMDGRFEAAGLDFLAAALSPDGSRLLVAGQDGRVRFLSVPELDPVTEPFDSTVVPANFHTYMPSVESPVAFTADGALLAHLDPAGDVVVRETDRGRILHVIAPPWRDEPVEDETPFTSAPSSVMALHFTPDGAGLALALEGGVALWRCGGQAPAAEGAPLRLDVEGPESVRVGETAQFRVRVGETAQFRVRADTGRPVVRELRVDGGAITAALGEVLEVRLHEAGRFQLEIVADDGQSSGRAERVLLVRP